MSQIASYNEKTGDFYLFSNDVKRCEEVGLTLSTNTFGPNGEKCWFTRTPYAMLPFYEFADRKAKKVLKPFWEDYQNSWVKEAPDIGIYAPEGEDYMPFQKAGIAFAAEKQNVLIGDDMGLGKTIQAVGLANYIEAKRVLVICPASIRLGWDAKVRIWDRRKPLRTIVMLSSKTDIYDDCDYLIISYNLATNRKIHRQLCEMDWDLVVLDEAHYLKNTTALRTKAIFGHTDGEFQNRYIVQNAKKVVALTGTPLINRPRECYALAKALHWESIGWLQEGTFQKRFNLPATRSLPEKVGKLPELHARLRCNFMIRRMKAEVLKDLPDKNYEMVYIESTGQIKEVRAKEKLIDFDPTNFVKSNIDSDGHVSTVRREMGEAKAERVVSHIEYLLDIKEIPKLVVGFHHHSVREILVDKLAHYGLHEFHGKMTPRKKQKSFENFINDGDQSRIFLGQLNSAGEGLDGMQAICSHVCFAEISWTPSGNQQFIDRVFRIGQHSNVTAQFLIVPKSFDERILRIVLEKELSIYKTLDDEIE